MPATTVTLGSMGISEPFLGAVTVVLGVCTPHIGKPGYQNRAMLVGAEAGSVSQRIPFPSVLEAPIWPRRTVASFRLGHRGHYGPPGGRPDLLRTAPALAGPGIHREPPGILVGNHSRPN
jgi:hypothetical protein